MIRNNLTVTTRTHAEGIVRRDMLILCLLVLGTGEALRETAEIVPLKVGALEGVRTPSTMAAEGNDLFAVDENHAVRVYSIEPFALKFTIGGKGDGPRDFQFPPTLWVTADTIVASDFMKSLWQQPEMLTAPKNGSGDIYWVDAKIIEDLKPNDWK